MDIPSIVDKVRLFMAAHSGLLTGLALGSAGFFLLTPILAPAMVVLMPADALVRERRPSLRQSAAKRVGRFAWHLFKDILGTALIALGIVLLFMPGQGLLTIFVGLIIADLPGKRRLLSRVLGSGKIRPLVDRLRERYRKEPLVWPGSN